jgi:hypothetical protein
MKAERQFKIGEVEFKLMEIPPLAAWEICELVRTAIGKPDVLLSETSDEDANPVKLMLALVAGLRREDVKAIRDALFEYVTFKTADQVQFIGLSGTEEMAFVDIGFEAIYEVMGRAFKVNFIQSFNEALNRLGIKLPVKGLDTDQSAAGQSPSS